MRDNLVPETKYEIFRFYGHENSLEARYPGLDYNYAPHRCRLSSFPHHDELFRALDVLHLTSHQIYKLCNWEGTLAQRDRFLTQNPSYGPIEDTTGVSH